MAIAKGRVDGGQGGKLGHSNMNHWDYTEAIKAASRKLRRHQAKQDVAQGLAEFEKDTDCENYDDLSNELSR